jgi:hypothetical protein
MAVASAAVLTTNQTNNQALVEIIASSSFGYKLLEVGLSVAVITSASTVGLGIPAAIGITPTTPAAFVFEDGGNSSTPGTTSALAWGTSPTMPTVQERRATFTATVGVGAVWTWPRGLPVIKARTLTMNNVANGTTTYNMWFVLDE